ncbi:MAG: glycosyltransferase [Verrucomicrobiota bacterium]
MPESITVSIILPNLNSHPYIGERLRSIREQTLKTYEVIVVDGFSGDGSWEAIRAEAEKDHRYHLYRESPRGVYDAINSGIEKSKGACVYIATSDDTMEPTCLEELEGALRSHPEAAIAQCELELIDKDGSPLPVSKQWRKTAFPTHLRTNLDHLHVRNVPYDLIAHYVFGMIYSSLTQILFLRSAYAKSGPFPLNYGTHGDFAWGICISAVGSTVYLSKKLATWRVHDEQLTASASDGERLEQLLKIMRDQLSTLPQLIANQPQRLFGIDNFFKNLWVGEQLGKRNYIGAVFRYPHNTIRFLCRRFLRKIGVRTQSELPLSRSELHDRVLQASR